MTEKMIMQNNYINEFLSDTEAWNAYFEVEIIGGFEELAQSKGMHLVSGSIQEKHREPLVWVPIDEEPYRMLRPRYPFGGGGEDADMTGIVWTAQAE